MAKKKQLWTVLSMLEWATGYFEKHGVPSPRLSIEWLLADLLDTSRLNLYLLYDRPLADAELDQLRERVKRRAAHEPLQYITGYTDFLSCRIELDASVLIPRQETEQLVSLILEETSERAGDSLTVVDLGTGSGCIPIAIKKARPTWRCIGVDISETALKKAEANAAVNRVEVEFLRSDLIDLAEDCSSLPGLDLLISNPPYILPGEKEQLEKEVVRYEPTSALLHEDPLKLYNAIARLASVRLVEGGHLYLECNPLLTGKIISMLSGSFDSVETRKDLDEIERFVKAAAPRSN